MCTYYYTKLCKKSLTQNAKLYNNNVIYIGKLKRTYAKEHKRKIYWFKANKIRTLKSSNAKRKTTHFYIKISTQKIIQ